MIIMTRLLLVGMLAVLVSSVTAHAQVGDAQRLVWQCGEAADERGLAGSARNSFIQRCVDTGGASARPGLPPSRPQAPAAASASEWRLLTPSRDELSLAITSVDRAFIFALTCTARAGSNGLVGGVLQVPRGWGFAGEATSATIDGVLRRMKVSGSDQDLVYLSDAAQDGTSYLTVETRRLLASGHDFRIAGLTTDGRRTRTAVFTLPRNEATMAEFERRCRGGR